MAVSRVDETLTAVTTSLADPDNSTEPMFLVQFLLEKQERNMASISALLYPTSWPQILLIFSDNLVRTGCFGFFVLAHVKMVEETVHVVEPLFDPDQNVAVSTGASKKVLKRLKKETFCMNQEQSNGDSSSGGACVVCLEDFSSSAKLTKLPCSHVFHKKCIFRWLRKLQILPSL
ncbi:hypothetical protein OIU78_027011 [Salix suchowensis]|nr:hypothetical protein OIU78_027011 [Salix suchowensis]